MAYFVTQPVVEYFTLLDSDGNGIAGATFSQTTIKPDGSSFVIVLTETGNGTYKVSFTPTSVGAWLVRLDYAGPPPRTFQSTFDVDSVGSGGTTVSIVGSLALPRSDVRRRIADRLGDLLIMNATSDSMSTSTFVDALNVSGASDNLDGRMLLVNSGANAGHIARIQSSNSTTSTITFTPPATTTFTAGDEIEIVNERSRGFTIPEYNRAITNAINDAWPVSMANINAAISGDFDLSSPVITVPDEMNKVYEVAWQDTTNGTWIPIRGGGAGGRWYGWSADPTAGTITIVDTPARLAEGQALRLRGYGRHQAPTADTDLVSLNVEWLVARACYHLALAGADRESARGNTILVYQREADTLKPRIITYESPGTVQVRAN